MTHKLYTAAMLDVVGHLLNITGACECPFCHQRAAYFVYEYSEEGYVPYEISFSSELHSHCAHFQFAQPLEEWNEKPAGTILAQDLRDGMLVKKGTKTITLTVSRGPNMIRVPDVVGQHRDQAEAALSNAGFDVKYTLESSDEVQENFVISLSPAQYPDELVYGASITMVVSTGQKPVEPVEVPEVLNISKEQAVALLTQAGFVVKETDITYVNNSSAPKNTVVAQSITGGLTAVPGTTITLEVSTGYQDVKVQIPLPDSSLTVDLQVYVNGELRDTFKGILPNVLKVKTITLTEAADTYTVTVKIAKTGTGSGEFLNYAEYYVDGVAGKATENYRHDDVLDVYGSTTTTTAAQSSTE